MRCPGGYHLKGTEVSDSKFSRINDNKQKKKKISNSDDKEKGEEEEEVKSTYLQASKNLSNKDDTSISEEQAKAVEQFVGDLIQRQVDCYLSGVTNIGSNCKD